jgi:hypothetical protein
MTLHLVALVILVIVVGAYTPFLTKRETQIALGVGAALGFLAALFFPAHEQSQFLLKFLGMEIHTTTDGRAFTFLVVFIATPALWALLRKITGSGSAAKTTGPVAKTSAPAGRP